MDEAQKKEKVAAAIKAHFGWFDRIRSAISSGKSEFKPEIVVTDNNCEFGKWIYSDMKAVCTDQNLYNEIKDVHAQFHKKAGEILAMALRGEKDAATKEVAMGSALNTMSGKLVLLLRRL